MKIYIIHGCDKKYYCCRFDDYDDFIYHNLNEMYLNPKNKQWYTFNVDWFHSAREAISTLKSMHKNITRDRKLASSVNRKYIFVSP
jgi:hypothetical protein